MINVLTTLNKPHLSKGPGRPCTARRRTGERVQENAQLPMGRVRILAVHIDFLKLLTFHVAVVSWYFFFQEGAS